MQFNADPSLVLEILLVGASSWLFLLLIFVLKRKFFRDDGSVEQTALSLTSIHSEFLRYAKFYHGWEFFRPQLYEERAHQLRKIYRQFVRHSLIKHPVWSFQRYRELSHFGIVHQEFLDHLDRSQFSSREHHSENILHEEFQHFLEQRPQSLWLVFNVVGSLLLSVQFAVASPAVVIFGVLLVTSPAVENASPAAENASPAAEKASGDAKSQASADAEKKAWAMRALQSVFWNTFFTRENEPDARLNAKSTSSYTLVLDLSAYNYGQIAKTNARGTRADPLVKSYLDSAPQEPVDLKIRPVTVTPQLVIEGAPVKTLRVNRMKLRRPQSGAAAADEDELIESFQRGDIKVAALSGKVAAGQVSFQVSVKRDAGVGCAVIAFTIWDFHDNPLDHLLQTVAIDDGLNTADCEAEGYGAEALKGGVATLLSPAFSIGLGDQTRPIQAALHLFETMAQGEKRSFAILVDKTQSATPQPGGGNTEQGVYGWRMAHWLSDYISAANGLPFQIGEAWKAAYKGEGDAYAQVANELATKIFGAEPGDETKADAAKAALRRIAETENAPIVIARLIGAENRKLYMPLGLIAAAGNSEGLVKPITVVQPLEVERYGAQRCIRTWSIGMSGDTKDLDPNVKRALHALYAERPDDEGWMQTNDTLRQYLAAAPGPSAGTGRGEGLVLLAHHDGFGVYFDNPKQRVTAEGFRRLYPPGSIALLASCVTSSPDADMAILNRLNRNGIDAMIVSPFKVRLDYSAKLALEFTKIVRTNRQKRLTPTLAQMFTEATEATTEHFKSGQRKERLEDMALEFVLVGDPYLRLCAP